MNIPKLRRILERHPRFVEEVFTEEERKYCFSRRDPCLHLAGRFAAKEACLKALGRGFSGVGIDGVFQEIRVASSPSGGPSLSLSGWAEKMSRKKKIGQISISISHTQDYAVATAIFVGAEE